MSLAEIDIPTANIANAQSLIDSDAYKTFPGVPVFREHETTSTRTGKTLFFSRDELQSVVDGCNRRINETGDYAMLTYGHTSDDPGIDPPDVAGFAGPFQLGKMELADGRECYCILADFHIPKADVKRFAKYPRRSPELWTGENGDMHLDPIALLGAIPPRLDMGLTLYQRRTSSGVERYQASAVAPGVGNVYIPSTDTEHDKDKEQYNMSLTSQDAKQIMDLIRATDTWQAMEQLVQESQGVNSTVEAEPEAFDEPLPPETADGPSDVPDVPLGEEGPPPGVDDEYMADAKPEPMANTEPPAEPPIEAEKPAAEAGQPPVETVAPETEPEPEADPNAEMYATLDFIPDDEFEAYCQYRTGQRKYEADGNVEVEAEDGSPDDVTDKEPEQYQRQVSRIQQLERKLQAETAARVNTERYSRLTQAGFDRLFDVDAEFERCRHGKLTDEQFNEHYEAIRTNYQQRPVSMPSLQPRTVSTEFTSRDAERYSMSESDAVKKECMDAINNEGRSISYKQGLERVRNRQAAAIH